MLSILPIILFFLFSSFFPYYATNLAYYSQKIYYTKYEYDRLHDIASSLSFGSGIVTLLKLECSPPVQTFATSCLRQHALACFFRPEL